jgi:hypothetical protein
MLLFIKAGISRDRLPGKLRSEDLASVSKNKQMGSLLSFPFSLWTLRKISQERYRHTLNRDNAYLIALVPEKETLGDEWQDRRQGMTLLENISASRSRTALPKIRIWHIVGLSKVETYLADNKQVRKCWSRSFLHRRLILVSGRFLWENYVHVMTLLSLSNL